MSFFGGCVRGVRSKISGDFDDRKFGRIMHITDTLLRFIYTPELKTEGSGGDPTGRVDVHGGGEGTGRFNQLANGRRGTSMDRPAKGPSAKVDGRGAGGVSEFDNTPNFVQILLEHFAFVPGTSTDDRVRSFFKQMDSSGDGLLQLEELREGIRTILKVPVAEMTDEQVTTIFFQMCDSDGEVNPVAFEAFLESCGDRENYNGFFRDCDPEKESGLMYVNLFHAQPNHRHSFPNVFASNLWFILHVSFVTTWGGGCMCGPVTRHRPKSGARTLRTSG